MDTRKATILGTGANAANALVTVSPVPPAARKLGAGQSLWLMGLVLVTFLAASTVPTPLYGIYAAAWGFSPLTLTAVFASYAIAMLAALLVFGSLSDHLGRREVLLVSLVLEVAAVLLFRGADSVGWLFAARILQGVATGIATCALGAGLLDLHRERGALINSVGTMVGLAVGGLGASVLVQFAPAPTRLVFDVLLVVFVLQIIAAFYLPETAARRPGAWRSLVPSISIPPQARKTLLQIAPVNTAQWALGGLFLSLGPTLTRMVTGSSAPVTGGALIAVLTFSSAAAMALVRGRKPCTVLSAGAAALAIGAVVTLAGIHFRWSGAYFAGVLIAGAGFGAAFSGSIGSLVPLAAPHQRAGLIAGFYVLSYLAFSLPAIAAGLATGYFGLEATALGYGIGVTLLATVAWVAMRRAKARSL